MRVWAMMAAALIASPAIAADQFDLVCRAKKEEWRFRVDLARGEWCAADCLHVQKVVSVTSGTITLADKKPAFRSDDAIQNSIDRATGEWTFYREMPSIGFGRLLRGVCESAPFSGFPVAKF